MTLYDELIAANIEGISNHESDLYVPVTPEVTAILDRHPTHKKNATTFVSNIDGKLTYDIPFAYGPFWSERQSHWWFFAAEINMKPDDTVYEGVRIPFENREPNTSDENEVTVNGRELKLQPSLKLRNHSPTGFNWGYLGSGCAQLALGILLDFTGDAELAQQHYMDFKREFIAPIQAPHWQLTGRKIREWLEARITVGS
jgi:hypothetical protein